MLIVAAAMQQAGALIGSVSSDLNDYNLSLDATERVMVFARSEADFKQAQIFTATRGSRGWSEFAPINFSDRRYADSDPWLTPDGRTLYFISDRPVPGREAGRTDYDIWRSTRTASGWSAPEHLGPKVNSRGQELGPELHEGVLYFSSARRTGAGGLDIHRAKANGRGFEDATLLQGPFNTAASESDFTLSPDGSAAMFWRSIGGIGTIHISYRNANGWSVPTPLPSNINAGGFNFTPTFSSDGQRIRYASTLERQGQPSGHADIYEAKLPPPSR